MDRFGHLAPEALNDESIEGIAMAIVTISRGTFGGGKAVAEQLAARLDHPCVSREEITKDAARDFEVSEARFNAAMVEPPSFWRQSTGKRTIYLNYFKAALLKRASDGRIVYHGQAGHLLLGNIRGVLRVRINADMAYRIASAMQQHQCSREQALALISDLDRQNIKWTRFLYGARWDDPALFDVVFNLEQMREESVVQTLFAMTALEDFQPDAASWKSFHDLRLGSMVWAALARDKRTRMAAIQVDADDGLVTLAGSVGSRQVLNEVLAVAQQVRGVKAVTSRIGIGANWMW